MSDVTSVTSSVTQALIDKIYDIRDTNQDGKISTEEEAIYDNRHPSAKTEQAAQAETAETVTENTGAAQTRTNGTKLDVMA